jgi:alkyl sulfatase BDS1-like metallo-beta-lactamase superfamily hydrolase
MAMTYKDLKEMLEQFTTEQLEQPVVIYHGEEDAFGGILDIVDQAWVKNPVGDINPAALQQVIITSEYYWS